MKAEIREVLETIGYSKAVRIAPDLAEIETLLDRRGGLIFANAVEAREALQALDRVAQALDKVPVDVRELWADFAKLPEDWDDERDILIDAINGLNDARRVATSFLERKAALRNSPAAEVSRDDGADQIAFQLAEIFVLGFGRLPSEQRDSKGQASGPYAKAVAYVFSVLNVPISYRKPCQRAISLLQGSPRLAALIKLHDSHEGVSPSQELRTA